MGREQASGCCRGKDIEQGPPPLLCCYKMGMCLLLLLRSLRDIKSERKAAKKELWTEPCLLSCPLFYGQQGMAGLYQEHKPGNSNVNQALDFLSLSSGPQEKSNHLKGVHRN